LDYVLGKKGTPRLQNIDEELEGEDVDRGSFTPSFESRKESKPAPSMPQSMKDELDSMSSTSSVDSEDDDAMSFFQRLANS